MDFGEKNKDDEVSQLTATTQKTIFNSENSRFLSYRRIIACTCLATTVAFISFSSKYPWISDNINGENKPFRSNSYSQGFTIHKNFTVIQKREEKLPEIAWLMTFPNSGTSFTTALIRDLTLTTTATNYASNMKKHPPLLPGDIDMIGPYIERPKMNLPHGGYILTKTHCTGCRSTTSHKQIKKTVNEFLDGCACSKDNSHGSVLTYDVQKVKKVIHLLRNPFDNIISRFHLNYKNRLKMNDTEWLRRHPDTKDGFRNWCKDYDKLHTSYQRDPFSKDLAKSGILCHAEFFQYVQWHNHAVNVTNYLGVPTYRLHYSDFAQDYEGTVNKLLKFLELKAIGEKHPFMMKSFDGYYSPEEKMAIVQFIRKHATDELWDLLHERYLKM